MRAGDRYLIVTTAKCHIWKIVTDITIMRTADIHEAGLEGVGEGGGSADFEKKSHIFLNKNY